MDTNANEWYNKQITVLKIKNNRKKITHGIRTYGIIVLCKILQTDVDWFYMGFININYNYYYP